MTNSDGRRLGDVLREARVAADLTLRDLAKRLSLSASYISDIENERRVPAEEVLRQLATELKLQPDELLAKAGRVGDKTERYLKTHPTAGTLFRKISDKRLPTEDLEELLRQVESMGKKAK